MGSSAVGRAFAGAVVVVVAVVPVPASAGANPRDDDTRYGAGVWDVLAWCESRGDWSTNTGNGYYGGLQFDLRTWKDYGGQRYAPKPHRAEREEQIAVARLVRDDRDGYRAWPRCARKLGLPR